MQRHQLWKLSKKLKSRAFPEQIVCKNKQSLPVLFNKENRASQCVSLTAIQLHSESVLPRTLGHPDPSELEGEVGWARPAIGLPHELFHQGPVKVLVQGLVLKHGLLTVYTLALMIQSPWKHSFMANLQAVVGTAGNWGKVVNSTGMEMAHLGGSL